MKTMQVGMMRIMLRWRSLVGLASVLTALVYPAYAQQRTVTDDEVNAIARRLYCPVCENIPLDTCGTPACKEWRAEIRAQLEAGWTEEQVINDFVAKYGERVVGTPQDPTLQAISLVIPWIVAAVALGLGALTMIRWRARQRMSAFAAPSMSAPTAVLSDDDYRARLERDLHARR